MDPNLMMMMSRATYKLQTLLLMEKNRLEYLLRSHTMPEYKDQFLSAISSYYNKVLDDKYRAIKENPSVLLRDDCSIVGVEDKYVSNNDDVVGDLWSYWSNR